MKVRFASSLGWFIVGVSNALSRGPLMRVGIASVVGTAASLALSVSIVLASGSSCGLPPNYFPTYNSPHYPFWYAQVQTCCEVDGSYLFWTQGGKANITTSGNPSVYDQINQHVLVALASKEKQADCQQVTKDKYPGCWIQTGWITGQDASCTDPNANTGGAIWVYVEIFDDSQPPNNCLEGNFGTPTSNASYDARYYGFINGFYRYNAYYQASNSTNIQLLAYGEFKDQKTAEIASAEIYANGTDAQPTPLCPVLGQKASGKWNIVGNTASNSFASQVQLYLHRIMG